MQFTSLDSDIRDHLLRYLVREIDLETFETWFVEATWGQLGQVTPWVAKQIGAIELLLAEYTSGHRTEEDLRERFRVMTEHVVVGEKYITTEFTGRTIYQDLEATDLALAHGERDSAFSKVSW